MTAHELRRFWRHLKGGGAAPGGGRALERLSLSVTARNEAEEDLLRLAQTLAAEEGSPAGEVLWRALEIGLFAIARARIPDTAGGWAFDPDDATAET
jgi:hypothetical protein